MDGLHKKCTSCVKKFKKTDEVVATNAGGSDALVHIDCLHDYVLSKSIQHYYSYYEDYLEENE